MLFVALIPVYFPTPMQQLDAECAAHVVPVIKRAVEDRSWRVRCAMARGFAKAAHAVGPKLTTGELLPCLTRYASWGLRAGFFCFFRISPFTLSASTVSRCSSWLPALRDELQILKKGARYTRKHQELSLPLHCHWKFPFAVACVSTGAVVCVVKGDCGIGSNDGNCHYEQSLTPSPPPHALVLVGLASKTVQKVPIVRFGLAYERHPPTFVQLRLEGRVISRHRVALGERMVF